MSERRIIGIDPGLSCAAWALAVYDSSGSGFSRPRITAVGSVKTKATQPFLKRVAAIVNGYYDWLCEHWYDNEINLFSVPVAIERSTINRSESPVAGYDLNFIIGALATIHDLDYELVIFAHKSTWRTQLLGAANLQPTKEVLQELLDIPEPKQMLRNTDRRDAVAIAGWAALHHKHIMEVDDEIDA